MQDKKDNTNEKGRSEPEVSSSSEKIMNRQCWGSKVGHKDRAEQETILKTF